MAVPDYPCKLDLVHQAPLWLVGPHGFDTPTGEISLLSGATEISLPNGSLLRDAFAIKGLNFPLLAASP